MAFQGVFAKNIRLVFRESVILMKYLEKISPLTKQYKKVYGLLPSTLFSGIKYHLRRLPSTLQALPPQPPRHCFQRRPLQKAATTTAAYCRGKCNPCSSNVALSRKRLQPPSPTIEGKPQISPPSSNYTQALLRDSSSVQGMKGFLSVLLSKPAASLRQLEHDVETVIKVLQPGPLGVVEHKFSDTEISQAEAAVRAAVENWKRNSELENRDGFMKHKE